MTGRRGRPELRHGAGSSWREESACLGPSGVFFCTGLDQLTEQNMAGSMWTPPSGLNNDILENSVPTTTILNAI